MHGGTSGIDGLFQDERLPVLQKITGHRSLRTLTEHYPGPSPEAVRAWYDESDPAARRRRGASG